MADSPWKDRVTVLICASGVFVCYFYYGILQESLLRGSYDGDKFTHVTSLLFLQCLVSLIISRVCLFTRGEALKDPFRAGVYPLLSVVYLGAMQCSNMALKYVNYPTQVVGKSCKPIPVMIIGVIFAGKRYPLQKYLFVFMIVAGVAAFTYKAPSTASTSTSWSLGSGEGLLIASLAMDGITAAIQDRLKQRDPPSSYQLMFSMNLWSTLIGFVASFATGDLMGLVQFTTRHPESVWYIVMFCCCSAMGQVFIFKSVTELSPLTCSLITTTRKCFTVLASVILFGNTLTQQQTVAVAIVFVGLFLDANYGRPPKSPTKAA